MAATAANPSAFSPAAGFLEFGWPSSSRIGDVRHRREVCPSSSSSSFRPPETAGPSISRGRMRTICAVATAAEERSAASIRSGAAAFALDSYFPLRRTAGMFRNVGGEEEEGAGAAVDERLFGESIREIVMKLGENSADLVHLFAISGGGGVSGRSSPAVRLRREAASSSSAESWAAIKGRWSTERDGPRPDAVVLVQQLRDKNNNNNGINGGSAVTTAAAVTWGMVVQWRGMKRVSCYLLDTTRVESSSGGGGGGACTHFCLKRARCLDESVEKQMRKAWLLQPM